MRNFYNFDFSSPKHVSIDQKSKNTYNWWVYGVSPSFFFLTFSKIVHPIHRTVFGHFGEFRAIFGSRAHIRNFSLRGGEDSARVSRNSEQNCKSQFFRTLSKNSKSYWPEKSVMQWFQVRKQQCPRKITSRGTYLNLSLNPQNSWRLYFAFVADLLGKRRFVHFWLKIVNPNGQKSRWCRDLRLQK